MKVVDWIRLLSPLVICFALSFICPVGTNPTISKNPSYFQPQGWVFSVVWFILYLLLGWAWVRMNSHYKNSDMFFALILAGLSLWILATGCWSNRKLAFYILMLTLGISLLTFSFSTKYDETSAFILTPFITWLIFASFLSLKTS